MKKQPLTPAQRIAMQIKKITECIRKTKDKGELAALRRAHQRLAKLYELLVKTPPEVFNGMPVKLLKNPPYPPLFPSSKPSRTSHCAQCNSVFSPESDAIFCFQCENKYGDYLLKATVDTFDYAFGLSNGSLISIRSDTVKIIGDWVHFSPVTKTNKDDFGVVEVSGMGNFSFERGFMVHISHIVFVADAPNGS